MAIVMSSISLKIPIEISLIVMVKPTTPQAHIWSLKLSQKLRKSIEETFMQE